MLTNAGNASSQKDVKSIGTTDEPVLPRRLPSVNSAPKDTNSCTSSKQPSWMVTSNILAASASESASKTDAFQIRFTVKFQQSLEVFQIKNRSCNSVQFNAVQCSSMHFKAIIQFQ